MEEEGTDDEVEGPAEFDELSLPSPAEEAPSSELGEGRVRDEVLVVGRSTRGEKDEVVEEEEGGILKEEEEGRAGE